MYTLHPPCIVRPKNTDELVQIILEANTSGQPFEIVGGGTKRSFGDPVKADAVLDMSRLSGIEFYEPEELVIKVRAGTPVSAVREALAANAQHLSFEPPDYAAFFGDDGADTIGGVIACNIAGPRRILAGAARDAVLGVEGVNGRGELFKGGGRTVKNVTGYDMPRLLTGSFGVLAALTSVTLKVHPRPTWEATVLLSGLDDAKAVGLISDMLRLPVEISAAVHLGGGRTEASTTALRLEGFSESVAGRRAEIEQRLHKLADIRTIVGDESSQFWRGIRDLSCFAADQNSCVWRLALPCMQAARMVQLLGGEAIYDWGGCQVFVRTTVAKAEEQAGALRNEVAAVGGNACLLRAPANSRRKIGTFHSRSEALQRLGERVRRAFDPKELLNPGKLGAVTGGAV
ncbi:glycolate oxidase subunit GlcE [Paraburkholderia sp. RL17-337-BIB-A]|uniref:glycolate oxidase subunit GlcE n=1 Tax=Paraburkholderia sp. RL17-337-BIB-A TaxID=3031636 RepID=UPI0038BBA0D5